LKEEADDFIMLGVGRRNNLWENFEDEKGWDIR